MNTFNSQQQITLDRSLFDLIINCLLANVEGDASCKHLLIELGRTGLYSTESIDSFHSAIGHENIQEASSTNSPIQEIDIQLNYTRSHTNIDLDNSFETRRSAA